MTSPSCRPAAAAGESSVTSVHRAGGVCRDAEHEHDGEQAIANTRLAKGPAKMTAIRFQAGARQYASFERAVVEIGEPLLGAAASGLAEIGALERSRELWQRCSCRVVVLARQRVLDVRRCGAPIQGDSSSARPSCASTSPAAGRCMPGIFT